MSMVGEELLWVLTIVLIALAGIELIAYFFGSTGSRK